MIDREKELEKTDSIKMNIHKNNEVLVLTEL